MTAEPSDTEGTAGPTHHPTPEELAVEIWQDESPAPEPDEESPPTGS